MLSNGTAAVYEITQDHIYNLFGTLGDLFRILANHPSARVDLTKSVFNKPTTLKNFVDRVVSIVLKPIFGTELQNVLNLKDRSYPVAKARLVSQCSAILWTRMCAKEENKKMVLEQWQIDNYFGKPGRGPRDEQMVKDLNSIIQKDPAPKSNKHHLKPEMQNRPGETNYSGFFNGS
jgi:hypothetical protein